MTQYEYTFLKVCPRLDYTDGLSKLEHFGSIGWRIISSFGSKAISDGTIIWELILEREIKSEKADNASLT